MNLEHPLDWLAVVALWAGRGAVWLIVTPAENISTLGPWFVPCWAVAIAGLWSLGSWGAAQGDVLFRGGEDVAAFSGGRATWLGFGAKIIRGRKQVNAAVSGAAVVIGWGGALLLYVVALIWWMCIPIAAGWAWWRWWSQQPRPWDL